jgi:hypothetical protein
MAFRYSEISRNILKRLSSDIAAAQYGALPTRKTFEAKVHDRS